jgi:hypothetical protein
MIQSTPPRPPHLFQSLFIGDSEDGRRESFQTTRIVASDRLVLELVAGGAWTGDELIREIESALGRLLTAPNPMVLEEAQSREGEGQSGHSEPARSVMRFAVHLSYEPTLPDDVFPELSSHRENGSFSQDRFLHVTLGPMIAKCSPDEILQLLKGGILFGSNSLWRSPSV